MIYFLQDCHGRIKIGYSKDDCKVRIAALQIGNSEKLSLVGQIAGSQEDEKKLHKRFAKSNCSGEWFYLTRDILNFLIKHFSKNAIPRSRTTTPPPPKTLGSVSAGEVMPLVVFGERMNLANRSLAAAQRAGLRTILFGRVKFVLGSDALVWFSQLAEKQVQETK